MYKSTSSCLFWTNNYDTCLKIKYSLTLTIKKWICSYIVLSFLQCTMLCCRGCGRVKLQHFYCCSGDRGNVGEQDDSTRWSSSLLWRSNLGGLIRVLNSQFRTYLHEVVGVYIGYFFPECRLCWACSFHGRYTFLLNVYQCENIIHWSWVCG
jgi:hypothetical protein